MSLNGDGTTPASLSLVEMAGTITAVQSRHSGRRRAAIRRIGFGAKFLLAASCAGAVSGCSNEARSLGPEQPLSAPLSAVDPRIAYFQANAFQVSQGGRYFGWYGCGECHTKSLDLGDLRWRHGNAFDQVYNAIFNEPHHVRYGARIPMQQRWQITAYVRQLTEQPAEKRQRQNLDQKGEPTGSTWNGPVR